MRLDRRLIIGNFKQGTVKPKRKREGNSRSHLADLRMCHCCIPDCNGASGVQVHHLKTTGKRGAGMKSPDQFGVPLCQTHHIHGVETVGSKNEIAWFRTFGIDALTLAAELWAATSAREKMDIVLRHRLRAAGV